MGLLALCGAVGRGGEGTQAFLKLRNSHLSSINAASPDYDKVSLYGNSSWDLDPR